MVIGTGVTAVSSGESSFSNFYNFRRDNKLNVLFTGLNCLFAIFTLNLNAIARYIYDRCTHFPYYNSSPSWYSI